MMGSGRDVVDSSLGRDIGVRAVRLLFIEWFELHVHWRDGAPRIREMLAQRRLARNWSKRILNSHVFASLLKYGFEAADYQNLFLALRMLQETLSGHDRVSLKKAREVSIKAKEEVDAAVRLVRYLATDTFYWSDSPSAEQVLKDLASYLIDNPRIAIHARGYEQGERFFPEGLIGQKGDIEAFAIRSIDAYLRALCDGRVEIENRDAVIRDLAALIDLSVTSPLVRSTLRKGRT
jgi:hypothetical protein